jgi:hypothetical protein
MVGLMGKSNRECVVMWGEKQIHRAALDIGMRAVDTSSPVKSPKAGINHQQWDRPHAVGISRLSPRESVFGEGFYRYRYICRVDLNNLNEVSISPINVFGDSEIV